MKGAKLSLMFLACTAAPSAFAQNTPDSQCGMTNLDRSSNMFTIVNPIPATTTQQCFITVVPKQSWTGGMPDLASSQLVEGNYEVTLSGGGGGGGGGGARIGGGDGGAGAVPLTVVRYLEPGVYRVTIGSGGLGGAPNGGNGGDGAPTSLSKAHSGETVAGFSGAENWNGSYPWSYAARRVSYQAGVAGRRADSMTDEAEGPAGQAIGGNGGRVGIGINPKGQDGGRLMLVASSGAPGKGGTDLAGHRFRHEVAGGGGGGAGFGNGGDGDSAAEDGKMKTGAMTGMLGGGGGGGAGGEGVADPGATGGNGFIKIALKDPPPPAASAQPAPMYVAPMAPVSEPAAPVVETVPPARPARVDRN